jgi:hypothetical protein
MRDVLGIMTPGVFNVPSECGQVYNGQTGRSIETRIKQHQHNIRLEQPDKSAVSEHSINLGHRIKLQDTAILSTKTAYMDRTIGEAVEIELRPNMIREVGLRLSQSCKPLIHTVRGRRKHRVRHCQSQFQL